MDQFDEKLKRMAEQEECIVPEGFDNHLQEILDDLPSKAKKTGLGAAKGALIAAAACAVLLCTAFAASPGLREMLAGALGGFAPYAQDQDGEAYVMDGVEVRVLSAMADKDTIRVYAQLKDLEGDRLTEHMSCMPFIDGTQSDNDDGSVRSGTMSGKTVRYDEETGTAIMVLSCWGDVRSDLSGAELLLSHLYDTQTLENISDTTTAHIPLDIEVMPVTTLGEDTQLAQGFFAESIRLSPLGLTAVTYGDVQYGYLVRCRLRLTMADGTEILSQREDGGPDGQGSYGKYGTDASRRVLIWNFPEPLDVEDIQTVTLVSPEVADRTFPVELPD